MHIKPMKPFFSQMFRSKTKDVITLFHKPGLAGSNRVLTLLKQGSAQSSETATVDQASDHSAQNATREPFDLDITEAVPTEDQLRSILEYVGSNKIGQVVEGASSISDAVKKLAANEGAFKRPVTVDWNQGRAVVGDNDSEILRILKDNPNQ